MKSWNALAGIILLCAAVSGCQTAGNGRAFALDETRSRFAIAINSYFSRWINALAGALERRGHARPEATALAEDVVLAIQGALVLARATDDPPLFQRPLARLAQRLG